MGDIMTSKVLWWPFKPPGAKREAVKPPPITPLPLPPVIPEAGEGEAGDIERRKRLRRGRQETFITGELEPITTGKKTLLG